MTWPNRDTSIIDNDTSMIDNRQQVNELSSTRGATGQTASGLGKPAIDGEGAI
jgi:hypothetical protein